MGPPPRPPTRPHGGPHEELPMVGRGAPPGSLYGGAIGNPTWDSLMGPAGDPARPPAGLPIMHP